MEQLPGLVWLSRPGPHSTGWLGRGYKNGVYVFAFHTVAYSILPLQYHRLHVMHTSFFSEISFIWAIVAVKGWKQQQL